jgi:hypothetical protein
MTTTMTYFMRIPRRFRPYLLLSFCAFCFIGAYLSRSLAEPGRMDSTQREAALGRRFVQVKGLMDINHATEAITELETMQREHEQLAEPITLSAEDELLALINVSRQAISRLTPVRDVYHVECASST